MSVELLVKIVFMVYDVVFEVIVVVELCVVEVIWCELVD